MFRAMDAMLSGGSDRELSPRDALQRSWIAWITFLVALTLFFLMVAGWVHESGEAARLGRGGFATLIAVGWLVVVVAVLVLKSHVFRAAWNRRPAEPGAYHRGLITIWAVLQAGGVLGLIVSLVTGSLLTGGLLAALMIMLTAAIRPSRRALGVGIDAAAA